MNEVNKSSDNTSSILYESNSTNYETQQPQPQYNTSEEISSKYNTIPTYGQVNDSSYESKYDLKWSENKKPEDYQYEASRYNQMRETYDSKIKYIMGIYNINRQKYLKI